MRAYICPKCKKPHVDVIDSRFIKKTGAVRRRRVCRNKKCKVRFTTSEEITSYGKHAATPHTTFADKTKKALMERIERVLLEGKKR